MNPFETKNLAALLRGNAYPGRGIVLGTSADGRRGAVVYFLTGRSENSRNRVLREEGGEVVLRPFDPARVSDPSLIFYTPIRRAGHRLVVTNGDQTDTICGFLAAGRSFADALDTRCFEPDAPNLTPRISGLLELDGGISYQMSILKRADEAGSGCLRQYFSYPSLPGVGHFLHTYAGDGNPLPSFSGEPVRVEIPNDLAAFAEELWDSLNHENRIALYVCAADLAGGCECYLRNRHEEAV